MFIYTGNIPKFCLYEMKYRDHFLELVRKQNKISMNIIYFPQKVGYDL